MKKTMAFVLLLMVAVYILPLVTVGAGDNSGGGDQDPPQTLEPGDGHDKDNAVKVSGKDTPVEADPAQDTQGGADAQSDQGAKTAEGGDQAPAQNSGSSFDDKTLVSVLIGGQKQELLIYDYLCGVLAAEMPASFPEEALKAQAVAARTYTLYKMDLYAKSGTTPSAHSGAQLCDNPAHCKAYCDIERDAENMWGQDKDYYLTCIQNAVRSTSGIVATYESEPIAAVFHSVSGERTEAAVDVWGSAYPYLVSVESPGGDAYKDYRAEFRFTQAEFKALCKQHVPSADLSTPAETWFRASQRSEAGGIITVLLGGAEVTGMKVREMLGLNSTNFKYSVEGDEVVFYTTGRGHGVGMSQYGAREMAESGKTYDEIIKWYYQGVELTLKQ